MAGDTPDDLKEMHNGLQDTAKKLPNAQVVEPQPDRVRFTSCH